MKVFLIGFRGAGKTTLGQKIARELDWEFADLDLEWEKSFGSILKFVETHGIEKFRESEANFLRQWIERNNPRPQIIATGGGVVDSDDSFGQLTAVASEKIFLDPPVEWLWERLRGEPDRLKIGDIKDFSDLEALWHKRRLKYQQIATFRVDNQDITQALRQIAKHLAR